MRSCPSFSCPAAADGAAAKAVIGFCFLLFLGAIVFSRSANISVFETSAALFTPSGNSMRHLPFQCPPSPNITCPGPPPPSSPPLNPESSSSTESCPEYFRWIHEDLSPWKETGITRDMVERAKPAAYLRLVALDGRLYVEWLAKAYQTRDVFTVWGILQLMRRYPRRLPDLDLMFYVGDIPRIKAADYPPVKARANASSAPPPLFTYCGDDATLDIVFPDWSFWGWPEINVKSWVPLSEDLKEGNRKMEWEKREPLAYWKGNPFMANTRRDLLRCNLSKEHDWNARLFIQDWIAEGRQGFKQSNMADQCTYRYKIYIEGNAWSVSEKYILACDSPTLLVSPTYYDFFTRGLMPLEHYWPINAEDKCRSIKFAVDWGNTHRKEAQAIGKGGSRFTQEKLKMDYVYDYMFHILDMYGKLMKYKPTRPPGAVEVCSETVACGREGRERQYMMESMVNDSRSSGPCKLPPPYDPAEMNSFLRKKASAVERVEVWRRHASSLD